MPASINTAIAAIATACLAFASMAEANSIHANPYLNTQINLTNWGSRFLWAWVAIMGLSLLGFAFWSTRLPVQHRAFHYISLAILTTATIAYFSMASNLGYSAVYTEYGHRGFGNRQIWYARYIDWFITTPLLLLELLLTTALPLSSVFIIIFMDIIMVLTGLIGSQVSSSYKWGYFVIGCLAMLFILYMLIGPARKSTRFFGPEYTKTYTTSAVYLLILWSIYPICWGLAEGGNVISVNAEMVFYGVLDFLAKPVFCMFHLWSIRNLDYEALRLQSGKASAYATLKHSNVSGAGVGNMGTDGAVYPAPVANVTNLNDRMAEPLHQGVNPIANNTSYDPATPGIGAVHPNHATMAV